MGVCESATMYVYVSVCVCLSLCVCVRVSVTREKCGSFFLILTHFALLWAHPASPAHSFAHEIGLLLRFVQYFHKHNAKRIELTMQNMNQHTDKF